MENRNTPSSACYLCPHQELGIQSDLIFHPIDIVQPTILGLQKSFYLPNTFLPPSEFSQKSFTAINQLGHY